MQPLRCFWIGLPECHPAQRFHAPHLVFLSDMVVLLARARLSLSLSSLFSVFSNVMAIAKPEILKCYVPLAGSWHSQWSAANPNWPETDNIIRTRNVNLQDLYKAALIELLHSRHYHKSILCLTTPD
jgi:hypothetical protein